MIKVLSEDTIDKIAAGEVVERPASCVKELCENAVDAGSTLVSVEIKDGGVSLIRVTDNGCGIPKSELRDAFLRHATSKISSIEDLMTLESLGFRGEALSSISAVSKTEVITRTAEDITAARLVLEGAAEKSYSEIGAPNGTTFLVRDLFFNTPVRKKFLKSAATEGSYVAQVMEHMAMSHPEVGFTFINNSKTLLQTTGRNNLKEVLYQIYGKEVTRELVEINDEIVSGYIAKPTVARSNRAFELFFVNGRFVKSQILSKAVEEAYRPFLMQHKFPFCVLHLNLAGALVDANVHPQKLEVRFSDNEWIYNYVKDVVREALSQRELIPETHFDIPKENPLTEKTALEADVKVPPEAEIKSEYVKPQGKLRPAMPFENTRIVRETAAYEAELMKDKEVADFIFEDTEKIKRNASPVSDKANNKTEYHQVNLFDDKFMSKKARDSFKILGQVFDTYWIVEYEEKLLFIDQHAAHEKVLYEKFVKQIEENGVFSQRLMPPIIISLDLKQEQLLLDNIDVFSELGFEIENFGGREYAIRAVPENFSNINSKDLFMEFLDDITDNDGRRMTNETIKDSIATKACKAAVKGNNRLSVQEIEALLDDLLTLENPYNCPHGRPTMFSMSKTEMEKRFKRIV